jgi:hypothetical protein
MTVADPGGGEGVLGEFEAFFSDFSSDSLESQTGVYRPVIQLFNAMRLSSIIAFLHPNEV